jgi:hypothetical protein
MFKLPPPLDVKSLRAARQAPAGGYETFEDVIYDTVTYPLAGVPAGGTLDFFANAANTADRTLTNLKQAGQLPGSHMFHCKRVFVTPIMPPSVAVALTTAGAVSDLEAIFNTSRSFLTFTSSVTNKTRGPIPLDMIGGAGGVVSAFGGTAAPAAGAADVIQHARLHPHGGYPLDFIIGTAETFSLSLIFGAQKTTTIDIPLRLTLYGWRYLKVA